MECSNVFNGRMYEGPILHRTHSPSVRHTHTLAYVHQIKTKQLKITEKSGSYTSTCTRMPPQFFPKTHYNTQFNSNGLFVPEPTPTHRTPYINFRSHRFQKYEYLQSTESFTHLKRKKAIGNGENRILLDSRT